MIDATRRRARLIEEAHEEERRRLAQILHEGLGQDLLVAQLTLELAEARSDKAAAPWETVREAAAILKKAIGNLRDITQELRPPDFADLDLAGSLELLASERSRLTGLAIRCRIEGVIPPLSVGEHILFYRAAQEGVSNVVRHAQATEIDILLGATVDTIYLAVKDDGLGLNLGDRHKRGSFGLLGMQERFASFGGCMQVENVPQGGAVLRVSLPRNDVTKRP